MSARFNEKKIDNNLLLSYNCFRIGSDCMFANRTHGGGVIVKHDLIFINTFGL